MIGLGTPPKDYYLQVDTGSDIMWVNCAGCKTCPTKSDLGVSPFFTLDMNLLIEELELFHLVLLSLIFCQLFHGF